MSGESYGFLRLYSEPLHGDATWGLFSGKRSVKVAKPHHAELKEWFFRALELPILVSGVVFTGLYSQWARPRREGTIK